MSDRDCQHGQLSHVCDRCADAAEIEKLRNDLADALDCKNGAGPTALSLVIEERDSLRAELAASRHELEGAKKAANAQARLIDSLEQQSAHLYDQRDQWIEARNTLDSERAANARLTDELAASREREARMQTLIADDGYAMTFQSLGQYRTALLRALAEGAQG